MKKVGTVLKYLFLAFLVVFNVGMIVRVQMQKDTSTLNDISVNEVLKGAFVRHGDEKTFVEEHEIPEPMTAGGHFSVYAFHYIPSANQLQVTVRMNKSVLKDLSASGLDFFSFIISDQFENNISESGRVTVTKTIYHYIRLTFDNVTIPDHQLYLVANTPTDRLAGLVLFDPLADITPYKLNKTELKLLK